MMADFCIICVAITGSLPRRSGAGKARGGMLSLRPDMGSLSIVTVR